jgi:hypothetical protein
MFRGRLNVGPDALVWAAGASPGLVDTLRVLIVFLRSLNVLRSLNAVSQDFGRQKPLARSEQPRALRPDT